MVRIKKIGIKQTAKFFAIYYFLMSLIFMVPIFIITLLISLSSNTSSGSFTSIFGGIFILFVPVMYAVMGFMMVAVASFFYNQLAKRIGGVEIEIDSDVEKSSGNLSNTIKIPPSDNTSKETPPSVLK